MLVVLGACVNETGLNKDNPDAEGPEDTDTAEVPPPSDDICYELGDGVFGRSGTNGWDSSQEVCMFYGAGGSGSPEVFFPDWELYLKSYSIKAESTGYFRAESPFDEETPIRFGMGVDSGYRPGNDAFVGIDLNDAVSTLRGGDGFWEVTASRDDGTLGRSVDELDDCTVCSFYPFVEIADHSASVASASSTSTDDCVHKYDVISWCPVWEDEGFDPRDEEATEESASDTGMAKEAASITDGRRFKRPQAGEGGGRTLSPEALAPDRTLPVDKCRPGNGTFVLFQIPEDLRGDTIETGFLWPIQTDGTGTLTDSATVNLMDLGDDQGLEPISAAQSGEDDTPLWGSRSRRNLTGRWRGDVRFSKKGHGRRFAASVDMEWTCPGEDEAYEKAPDTGEAAEGLALSPYYRFSLADIGCPLTWPQEFSLLIIDGHTDYSSGTNQANLAGSAGVRPPLIQVGLFGSRQGRVTKRTLEAPSLAGNALSAELGPLTVDATLLSYDSDGALVFTEAISLNGVPICESGYYYLPALR
ncbi:MAG: hypothetical protein ACOZNI_16290 [Myxococcota bacterium]